MRCAVVLRVCDFAACCHVPGHGYGSFLLSKVIVSNLSVRGGVEDQWLVLPGISLRCGSERPCFFVESYFGRLGVEGGVGWLRGCSGEELVRMYGLDGDAERAGVGEGHRCGGLLIGGFVSGFGWFGGVLSCFGRFWCVLVCGCALVSRHGCKVGVVCLNGPVAARSGTVALVPFGWLFGFVVWCVQDGRWVPILGTRFIGVGVGFAGRRE